MIYFIIFDIYNIRFTYFCYKDLVKTSAEGLVKAAENFHNKLEDLKLAE